MGHDLDQVMRHAPGALSTLKHQRYLLDQQIVALEAMQKAHDAIVLQYKVTENGNVEDVTPVIETPAPVPPTVLEDKRSHTERILEVFQEIKEPMRAEDVAGFVEMDQKSLRATLARLTKSGKIVRKERGLYAASA